MEASPNPTDVRPELAASRCADLATLVHQSLFDRHPETRAMFRSQGSSPPPTRGVDISG
ncbi:hypothetical protein [Bradyrhizobium daqingense]|uniref:hypothetical protein n=1 Tax=Bradyrhizobium daqingense TaxID=993502 RepID=UPI003222113C